MDGLVRGTGCILLVDDEQEIRDVMSRMLMVFGYEVLLAENGERALEVFGDRHEEIDIVIMDITMPGMSGLEALKGMKSISEAVRVLFSSGGSHEAERLAREEPCALGFIQKPFSMVELSQQVAVALSS